MRQRGSPRFPLDATSAYRLSRRFLVWWVSAVRCAIPPKLEIKKCIRLRYSRAAGSAGGAVISKLIATKRDGNHLPEQCLGVRRLVVAEDDDGRRLVRQPDGQRPVTGDIA